MTPDIPQTSILSRLKTLSSYAVRGDDFNISTWTFNAACDVPEFTVVACHAPRPVGGTHVRNKCQCCGGASGSMAVMYDVMPTPNGLHGLLVERVYRCWTCYGQELTP